MRTINYLINILRFILLASS